MTREEERRIAASLGDGPLAMFDDGLPLKFLRSPESKREDSMGALTKQENEWLDKATAAAVAGARKIVLGNGPLMNTPAGAVKEEQWGWIIGAAIFGWIEVRVQQAVAEGRDSEEVVRLTGLSPSPCDSAVV